MARVGRKGRIAHNRGDTETGFLRVHVIVYSYRRKQDTFCLREGIYTQHLQGMGKLQKMSIRRQRFIRLSLLALLFLTQSLYPGSPPIHALAQSLSASASGRLLVQCQPHHSPQLCQAQIEAKGGQILTWWDPIHTALVAPAQGRRVSQDQLLNSLAQSASVQGVQADDWVTGTGWHVTAQLPPILFRPAITMPILPVRVNDPDFSNAQKVYAPQQIRADQAWLYTMGSPDVVIAVLDTGVKTDHPEMEGRVLSGYNFVSGTGDTEDDHGHGTHVAGIIAAAANNQQGSAGICPFCRILPVKVLNHQNVGTWSSVINGILYAVEQQAHIINLSLGGRSKIDAVESAIQYAVDAGTLVIGAAGNLGGDEPFYPAAYAATMAIGAIRNNDSPWPASNYGEWIDLVAPGFAIYSTTNDLENYYEGYTFMSGTSMAAPHVAGVAGLLLSQSPTRTVADLRQILTQTALDLGQPGVDPQFGHGRLDSWAALHLDPPEAITGSIGGRFEVTEETGGEMGGEMGGETNSTRLSQQDDPDLTITIRVDQHTHQIAEEFTFQVPVGIPWLVEPVYPGSYEIILDTNDYSFVGESAYNVTVDSEEQIDLLVTLAAKTSNPPPSTLFLPLLTSAQ